MRDAAGFAERAGATDLFVEHSFLVLAAPERAAGLVLVDATGLARQWNARPRGRRRLATAHRTEL